MKTIVSPSGKSVEWDRTTIWEEMKEMEDGWHFFIVDEKEEVSCKLSVALFEGGEFKKFLFPPDNLKTKEDLERWLKLRSFE